MNHLNTKFRFVQPLEHAPPVALDLPVKTTCKQKLLGFFILLNHRFLLLIHVEPALLPKPSALFKGL